MQTSAVSAASTPFADFPGWLPPMLVKELRQGLRAKGFVGFFIIMHAIAVCVYWFTIETSVASAGLQGTYLWLNGGFWLLLTITMLFIIPFRGLGGLRTEMESRTLDLLVLTHLTPWDIVVGKWIALMAQALLFLIAVLPYGVVRYFFGSVDFMTDLTQASWLLLGCATTTAAALWVSTLPKVFRILLPVALVFVVQGAGMGAAINSIISGRMMPGRAIPWWSGLGVAGTTLLGSLLLVFLGLAVRRLAPMAENHAAPARIFGFTMLLAGIAVACVLPFIRRELLGFTLVWAVLVAALELAHDRLPMRGHWRPWSAGWKRAIGRVFLPGWPSAAIFTAIALALVAAPMVSLSRGMPTGVSGGMFLWLMVQIWIGLVFPALLLSFLPVNSSLRVGGSGYFVLHGLFGTVSLMSATNSVGIMGGAGLARGLDALCSVLPISSFYYTAEQMRHDLPTSVLVGQAVVLAILLVLVWRQSRAYWAQLHRFDVSAAQAAAAK